MSSKSEKQRQFAALFLFGVLADLLVGVAVATKDEIWGHLALLWTGPVDDILFAVVAIQAFLYLIDPTGEKTQAPNGEYSTEAVLKLLRGGENTEKVGASHFAQGAHRALLFLSVALVIGLLGTALSSSPLVLGLLNVAQRHLGCVLPVFVVLMTGGTFLRLVKNSSGFWKASALAAAAILVVAFHEGRFVNYFYHLLANLESFYAWSLAFSWAGYFFTPTVVTVEREAAAA